jgi:MFS family permease
MALVAAFLGWMFDGVEIGLFPIAGRPALRELLNATGPDADRIIGPWFSAIVAAFLLGAALGGVVFGWLGDRVGRVRAMILSVLTYSVFSGLCALVETPMQLAVLRFIASMGMGGEWALGVALVAEVWPNRSRPLMAGLIGAAANVGFMLVGFVALGVARFVEGLGELLSFLPAAWVEALLRNSGWRMIFVAGALPAFLTLLIRFFVPESPKWKSAVSTGPRPQVSDLFRGSLKSKTILGSCLAGVGLLGTWGAVQFLPAWAAQFTGDPQKAAWTQIVAACGAIVIPIAVALLAERFNRRAAYIGLCAGSLLACQLLFWGFRVDPQFGAAFLTMAFFVNGITGGFYGWLPLYLPELFPTRVRATGAGLTYNAGRVIAAVGTVGSGSLLSVFGSYAVMGSVMSLIYLLGFVVIAFAPETKGRPLPE